MKFITLFACLSMATFASAAIYSERICTLRGGCVWIGEDDVEELITFEENFEEGLVDLQDVVEDLLKNYDAEVASQVPRKEDLNAGFLKYY